MEDSGVTDATATTLRPTLGMVPQNYDAVLRYMTGEKLRLQSLLGLCFESKKTKNVALCMDTPG